MDTQTPLPFNLTELRDAIFKEEMASGRLANHHPNKIRDMVASVTTVKFLMEHIWPVREYREHLSHLMEKWRDKPV
jgi:hypothetical protein